MSFIHFEWPEPGLDGHGAINETPDQAAFNREWDSVLSILTDYVQPNSTLSLDDAVKQVARFWNKHRGFTIAVLEVPIAMSEQIPYDHPAHSKLAEFMLALHDSGKWIDPSEAKDRACAQKDFWNKFTMYLWDHKWGPEKKLAKDEKPIAYANFCTFVANLRYPDYEKFRFDYLMAKAALHDATRSDTISIAEVYDARVIAAAQYVIHFAEIIFDEVIKLREREVEFAKARGLFSKLLHPKRKMERHPEEEFSWEDWKVWRSMFHTAAIDTARGKDSREYAQRAADMMALQEKVHGDRLIEV